MRTVDYDFAPSTDHIDYLPHEEREEIEIAAAERRRKILFDLPVRPGTRRR